MNDKIEKSLEKSELHFYFDSDRNITYCSLRDDEEYFLKQAMMAPDRYEFYTSFKTMPYSAFEKNARIAMGLEKQYPKMLRDVRRQMLLHMMFTY